MSLKARNPALKVGQYTNGVNDAVADPARTADDDLIVKLDAMNWWLRDPPQGPRHRRSHARKGHCAPGEGERSPETGHGVAPP